MIVKYKFCELLSQMLKETDMTHTEFYTKLGIKKPYFYDILSGKVNPPPPKRQFDMIKLLNLTKEQTVLFFNIAANERKEVPADIVECLKDEQIIKELRRNINYGELLNGGKQDNGK